MSHETIGPHSKHNMLFIINIFFSRDIHFFDVSHASQFVQMCDAGIGSWKEVKQENNINAADFI